MGIGGKGVLIIFIGFVAGNQRTVDKLIYEVCVVGAYLSDVVGLEEGGFLR